MLAISENRHDRDNQEKSAEKEQPEASVANLSDGEHTSARPNWKSEMQ